MQFLLVHACPSYGCHLSSIIGEQVDWSGVHPANINMYVCVCVYCVTTYTNSSKSTQVLAHYQNLLAVKQKEHIDRFVASTTCTKRSRWSQKVTVMIESLAQYCSSHYRNFKQCSNIESLQARLVVFVCYETLIMSSKNCHNF